MSKLRRQTEIDEVVGVTLFRGPEGVYVTLTVTQEEPEG